MCVTCDLKFPQLVTNKCKKIKDIQKFYVKPPSETLHTNNENLEMTQTFNNRNQAK